MTEHFDEAVLLYKEILRARDLAAPDGRPLFRYRLTRTEFELLTGVLQELATRSISHTTSRALLLMYLTEWFRRERAGGHWDWIRPLQSVNIDYQAQSSGHALQYSQIRDAIVKGFGSWRRPKPKSGSLLQTVVSESGFPVAATSDGKVGAWLRNAVLRCEDGFTPEEAIAIEAWRAPETIVQSVHMGAVELCAFAVSLRARIPDDAGIKSMRTLERLYPEWRDDAPFEIEDKHFNVLVDDLISAKRKAVGALVAIRKLVRAENGWQHIVELSLSGTLDIQQLDLADLARLDSLERVRVFAVGGICNSSQPIAILEKAISGEDQGTWHANPLIPGFELPLSLDTPLRLALTANGNVIAEYIPPGGESFSGQCLALEPIQDCAIEDCRSASEFLLIGNAAVQSTKSWLGALVPNELVEEIRFERSPVIIDSAVENTASLYAFENGATIRTHGNTIRWRAGSDRDRARRLSLSGRLVRRAEEPIYRGTPLVWETSDSLLSPIAKARLSYRYIGERTWRSLGETQPIGRVEIALFSNEIMEAQIFAKIVPEALEFRPLANERKLEVSGFEGGEFLASGAREVFCHEVGVDRATIDLSKARPGEKLKLEFNWSNSVSFCIPDPVSDQVIIGPDGGLIPRGHEFSINQLEGYRLLTPHRAELLLELIRPLNNGQPTITRTISNNSPLAALSNDIRILLASGGSIDSEVVLSWTGGHERIAKIKYYEAVAQNSDHSGSVFGEALGQTWRAISLSQPSSTFEFRGTIDREALELELGSGPWLIGGENFHGQTLRPLVHVVEGESTATDVPFLDAIVQTSRDARRTAFAENFQKLDSNNEAELKHLVRLCVCSSIVEFPFCATDALTAVPLFPDVGPLMLAACANKEERAAVLRLQNDLPFMWLLTTLSSWIAAFESMIHRMKTELSSRQLPEVLAEDHLLSIFQEISDLEPSLVNHTVLTALHIMPTRSQDILSSRFFRASGFFKKSDFRTVVSAMISRRASTPFQTGGEALAALNLEDQDRCRLFDEQSANLIAAPIAAAQIATSVIAVSDELAAAARSTWICDPIFFMDLFEIECLKLAQA